MQATRTLDVEGLTDEQIELARQFIEIMKRNTRRQQALSNLRALLYKGVETGNILSAEEAEQIVNEAVAYARG